MATSRKQAAATSEASKSKGAVQADNTQERVAMLAYLKAEARGFTPGHELDDWLEAEQEINGPGSSGLGH